MRRLIWFIIGIVGGYTTGTAIGIAVISALSDNRHDASLEAAMGGALVVGPAVAFVGGVLAFVLAGRLRPPPSGTTPKEQPGSAGVSSGRRDEK